ncbi:MAG: alpha/beta fold hydrolase [Bacteroidota bacterium]
MELFFKKYGNGPYIIILHGLYGNSDNWNSIAKVLANNYEVIVPDQRNHGKSPHSQEHSYFDMQNDLLELMDKLEINKTVLIGHSMGGKTAMLFAKNHPERLSNLIVIDISPKSYSDAGVKSEHFSFHDYLINILNDVDPAIFRSRFDAEKYFEPLINDPKIRQFILKNLKRNNNNFEWGLNVNSLKNNLKNLLESGFEAKYSDQISGFPVLFIKGENSDYITQKDYPLIKSIFPAAEITTIKNAGHWLHSEQPEKLTEMIKTFINS